MRRETRIVLTELAENTMNPTLLSSVIQFDDLVTGEPLSVSPSFGASEAIDFAMGELRDRFAALSHDEVAHDSRLIALRGIALSRQDHSREETLFQMHGAVIELSQAREWEWAAAIALRWLELHTSRDAFHSACESGMAVLTRFPELAQTNPATLSAVASNAYMAGDWDLADRCWAQARSIARDSSDTDLYWRIESEWAVMFLATHQGQLAKAITVLRRARNHFLGRKSYAATELAHFASMNIAYFLLWMGETRNAIELLEQDWEQFQTDEFFQVFMAAYFARAYAEHGDIRHASMWLERTGELPVNNRGIQVGVKGIARIHVAARQAHSGQLSDVVSNLLAIESGKSTAPDERALWRIHAARAFSLHGQDALAQWHLDDAIEICREFGLPHAESWARLERLAYEPNPIQSATEWVDLVLANDLTWLVTTRNPRAACHALLLAVAGGSPHVGKIRALLLSTGAHWYREALSKWPNSDAWNSPEVIELVSTYRWNDNAPTVVNEPASGVRIELFGGLRIFRGAEDITMSSEWQGRRKARLLIARLLVAHEYGIGRDDLAEDLWPGVNPTSVKSKIAPLVYVIRRTLEPDNASDETGIRIVASNRYSIELGINDSCDLIEFDALQSSSANISESKSIERMRRCLDLYRGPLLAGEGYEDWIHDARMDYEEHWRQLVLKLSAAEARRGNLVQCERHLVSLVDADPTCEIACRMLMQIYAERGELGMVNDCFHSLRHVLDSEFGLTPSPETRDAYSRLIV
jgi:DNA-binding SARP family transcriptional activator